MRSQCPDESIALADRESETQRSDGYPIALCSHMRSHFRPHLLTQCIYTLALSRQHSSLLSSFASRHDRRGHQCRSVLASSGGPKPGDLAVVARLHVRRHPHMRSAGNNVRQCSAAQQRVSSTDPPAVIFRVCIRATSLTGRPNPHRHWSRDILMLYHWPSSGPVPVASRFLGQCKADVPGRIS